MAVGAAPGPGGGQAGGMRGRRPREALQEGPGVSVNAFRDAKGAAPRGGRAGAAPITGGGPSFGAPELLERGDGPGWDEAAGKPLACSPCSAAASRPAGLLQDPRALGCVMMGRVKGRGNHRQAAGRIYEWLLGGQT